jgi:hypothetical protein
MDASLKVVTHLPLRELWRSDGFSSTSRGRALDRTEITGLLRGGPAHFVIVDVGFSPQWIEISDCYRFWKEEARDHLSSAESKRIPGEPRHGYVYFASEWIGDENAPIVVLEKHH